MLAPNDKLAPTTAQDTGEPSLWSDLVKVYPKVVKGKFRTIKWAVLWSIMGVYWILPLLRWDRGPILPDQAVLIDFGGYRAYIFAAELWPQQIYYLTGVLVLGAIALFLVSTLVGRAWCGFACPQSLWIDMFQWVERFVEGDRGQRIRLDKGPWTARKVVKKLTTHTLFLLISAFTGGYFILYFFDAPTFVVGLFTGDAPSTGVWFAVMFTASAYLLGALTREQFCVYMCPWPRFQAAMLDEHSLVVSYRAWRGGTPAKLRKSVTWEQRAAKGQGDCIDCNACVHACPAGIDIRQGTQMGCIGCGLCIDACDDVMTRIGRPTKLIAFVSEHEEQLRAAPQAPQLVTPMPVSLAAAPAPVPTPWLRPRTVMYGMLLVIGTGLMGTTYALHPRVAVSVLHDRAPLFVSVGNGDIRNAYTLKISNMTAEAETFHLEVSGLPGVKVRIAGQSDQTDQGLAVNAAPDSVHTVRLFVQAPQMTLPGRSVPITFKVLGDHSGEQTVQESVFFGAS